MVAEHVVFVPVDCLFMLFDEEIALGTPVPGATPDTVPFVVATPPGTEDMCTMRIQLRRVLEYFAGATKFC